jgi:alpha-glucosidase
VVPAPVLERSRDLNWDHPDVRREHEEILLLAIDRGAAGIRIDSAALLVKDPTLPEIPSSSGPADTRTPTATSCTTSIAWRPIADELS